MRALSDSAEGLLSWARIAAMPIAGPSAQAWLDERLLGLMAGPNSFACTQTACVDQPLGWQGPSVFQPQLKGLIRRKARRARRNPIRPWPTAILTQPNGYALDQEPTGSAKRCTGSAKKHMG